MVQLGGCVYSKEEDGFICLYYVVKIGNLEMVSLLLSIGQVDVNVQDSGGWMFIIWVVEYKYIDVICMLLIWGVDVILIDNEENICLYWVFFIGSVVIVEVFLNVQCDFYVVNYYGDMFLYIVVRESYYDCVLLFLFCGVNFEFWNKEGDMVWDLILECFDVWFVLQFN